MSDELKISKEEALEIFKAARESDEAINQAVELLSQPGTLPDGRTQMQQLKDAEEIWGQTVIYGNNPISMRPQEPEELEATGILLGDTIELQMLNPWTDRGSSRYFDLQMRPDLLGSENEGSEVEDWVGHKVTDRVLSRGAFRNTWRQYKPLPNGHIRIPVGDPNLQRMLEGDFKNEPADIEFTINKRYLGDRVARHVRQLKARVPSGCLEVGASIVLRYPDYVANEPIVFDTLTEAVVYWKDRMHLNITFAGESDEYTGDTK